jgi:anti-anti-sigma regulatory factor
MFRITTHVAADKVVFKLEGVLWGAWVGELDECWREATRTLNGRPMLVDLTDVYSVDDTGRQFLALMYSEGARFVARGCVMRELVREIAESVDVSVRN